jgi:outer membrane protein
MHACFADDLLQVYAQARATDPVLAGAEATRHAGQELVVQARAALLPSASATLAADRGRVAGYAPPDAHGSNADLVVSQPLVDVAAHDRLSAASRQAEAQDATWRAADQDLRLRVATAYFAVLTTRDTLANAQANEDALQQQVDQSSARLRSGLSAAVDVDQARAYYQTARAQTIDAQRALDAARDALEQLTGTPPGDLQALRESAPSTPPPALEDAPSWIARARVSSPELQAAEAAAAAAESQVAAAHAGHLPTLAAGLDVGRAVSRPYPDTYDGRVVTTATLTLTVPLFAGGATQSLARQAAYQRDAARDALEAQKRQTQRDVRDRLRDTLAARAQERATAVAVEAAARALASTRVGQSVGTQTMTDLLLAIQTLASARNAYSQARHQAVLGTLQLARAAGTLGDDELASVNRLLH